MLSRIAGLVFTTSPRIQLPVAVANQEVANQEKTFYRVQKWGMSIVMLIKWSKHDDVTWTLPTPRCLHLATINVFAPLRVGMLDAVHG